MKFSEGLDICPGVTALIGGGGKTGLMLTLADELKKRGSVIICTTTRIYPPPGMPVLTDGDADDIAAALKEHGAICVGEHCGEKLGPAKLSVSRLAALADYVIAEADGAKGLPLKAHAEYEPVIPEGADVIYVVGADGIGKPIGEAAHRPELYADKLGVDAAHIVSPEDAASMVDYGSKALFNKAESPIDMENGRRFAAAFFGKTVIASLKNGEIYDIIAN